MIVDAVIFNDELEMLDLRLNILAPVVDRFVIVEAVQTFQGQPKSLHYAEHAERFKPWADKILHVPVTSLPMTNNPWEIEAYQRMSILRGLADCGSDDVAIVSDVDEIPNPAAVASVANAYQHRLVNSPAVLAFEMALYSFTLNWRHVRPWFGTRMLRCRHFIESTETPQSLRSTVYPRPHEMVVHHGGWSFSWFGGVEAVRAKAQAFSHAEINRPDVLSDANIARSIREGVSLVAGDGNEYRYQELDDSYPRHLIDNIERYQHWLAERAVAERQAV